uniref:PPM-type phosphatase domain-containing protein n=1 Tax=Hanusia phi TaxID=3032 RepID=A0A7S0HQD2_9CRYP
MALPGARLPPVAVAPEEELASNRSSSSSPPLVPLLPPRHIPCASHDACTVTDPCRVVRDDVAYSDASPMGSLWRPIARNGSGTSLEIAKTAQKNTCLPCEPEIDSVNLTGAVDEKDRSEMIDSVAMPPPRPHPHLLTTTLLPVAAIHKDKIDEQSDSEASCRSTPPVDCRAGNPAAVREAEKESIFEDGNPPHRKALDDARFDARGLDSSKARVNLDQENLEDAMSEAKRKSNVLNAAKDETTASNIIQKKRRKEKSAVRLSFSDDLEESNRENVNSSSISQLTKKRFKLEEKNRRRRDDAGMQEKSAPFSSEQLKLNGAVKVFDDDIHACRIPLQVRHDLSERQGKRPYMEDTSLVMSNFIHRGWHLFGVFDGHGGSRASKYARDNLPHVLQESLQSEIMPGENQISEAMSASFAEIDRRFLSIAREEQLRDGTTALLALLRNNYLHMGWVGDSRGVLSRQGRYLRVSEDHKPDRPDERKAVEARGGHVIFRGTYRVAGPTALAVSRAIGDILMKEPRKLVTSDPEIKTIELLPQDEFLVMASDGLFDVMRDQCVIETVSKHIRENKSCKGAADKLTEMAIEKGSLDNVTALVVQFLWSSTDD